MTGHWAHPNLYRAATYALELLVGKKGFLLHNLALFFAVPGAMALIVPAVRRSNLPQLPELMFAAAWSTGTWLLYAWGSKNYSGACLSVRWFVPLLAPGYYILLLVLRQRPDLWPAFLAVNCWAVVIGTLAWWKGPWAMHMVPGFWLWLGAALVSYGVVWWKERRPQPTE